MECEAPTKLYVALHAARSAMRGVAKGGTNTFDRYKYATLSDYIDVIKKPLDDNGLLVVSDVVSIEWADDRQTQSGKAEKVCRIMLKTTVIHAESGQSMSVTVLGEGQDRADKAFYKADTGARKYGLANLFNLATDDDPEDEGSSEARTKTAAPKPAAKPPAKAPEKTAAPQTLTTPPGWPDTPSPELVAWVNGQPSTAALATAVGILVAEPALTGNVREWEPVLTAIGSTYKLLTKNFKANRNTDLELRIKSELEALEMLKHADQSLSEPQEATV